MTFTEFCEKQEITEECCKDTLDICAKINPHLKEFLKKYTYRELPCFYIKQFLEEYNYSKVNTKTGEILEPTELLPKIYPKIVDNISFTLNTEYHPSPYDKYMPLKSYPPLKNAGRFLKWGIPLKYRPMHLCTIFTRNTLA